MGILSTIKKLVYTGALIIWMSDTTRLWTTWT